MLLRVAAFMYVISILFEFVCLNVMFHYDLVYFNGFDGWCFAVVLGVVCWIPMLTLF